MYSFVFPELNQTESLDFLDNSTCIWILHADKIPPHIGISSNGYFFSLKVNGKDELIPVKGLLSVLDKKAIPTVLVELTEIIEIQEISRKFSRYSCAGTRTVTCLDPINKLLFCPENVIILSDLLHFLQENEKVSRYVQVNGGGNISGIKKYSIESIQSRLTELEHVKRGEYIFKGS